MRLSLLKGEARVRVCDLIPVVEPLTSLLSPSARGEAESQLPTASTCEFI
jgi:hypothetical protein